MKKNGSRSRKTRLFDVIVTYDPREKGRYKYTVDVPALPGCFSEGRTREEALKNIKEAIAIVVSVRAEHPSRHTETIEVAV